MTNTTNGPASAEEPFNAKTSDLGEIFELFPIPTLVVSPSQRIQRASAGLLQAWNRQLEELVGRDLFAFLYQDSPTKRFDRISLAYAIETAISTRNLRICYAAYTTDESSWSARIIPVFKRDQLLCLILEWEQVDHLTWLMDSESTQSRQSIDGNFRTLVQAVKDYAIFLLDTRGNVVTWNTGAELHKGYKKDEIIGRHFSIFYGAEDLRDGKPERELDICLREGRVEDEGWRYRKDGSRFWANVVITAVYRNGVHVGFGKVTRDLTERKDAELRLVAAYEENTKLKDDFLANMSHEIRTPMHGMLSACALLLHTPLTEEQRETANIIDESGQVLLKVINDILDYSKLNSGSFFITQDVVDVASILTSVVRSVHTTLQSQVSLDLILAPELPISAGGDPLRYRQVAQNLISNAAKFTEEGSVLVRASVSAEDEASCTILTEVTDTGPGVSDRATQRLFKPFTQLDRTITKRHQGTGLGLSIAKSLAELMDGQVGYRPNPGGRGSIFWFTAKLAKIEATGPGQDTRLQTEAGRRVPQQLSLETQDSATLLGHLQKIAPKKRVLAAEDNLVNQKVLVGMLQSFGFDAITLVSDGAQAVSTLSDSPQAYDVVLMDISMPVMDGYEATAHIRNHGLKLPIIAMTAYALKGDMELCLEKGMDDYIAKPMNKKLLSTKLLRWLADSTKTPLRIDILKEQ